MAQRPEDVVKLTSLTRKALFYKGRISLKRKVLAVEECARKAGIVTPITPHAIRRACATHMLRRGAHPVQLQILLGHASLKCLSQYLRVTFQELRAMHERGRLGQ